MVNNRLTEQLIVARSKCSDFRSAVKLNAWGGDIDDISICLEMPRLEVLALSLNKIRNLSSLTNCHRLKELYLRNNEVEDFAELRHLKNAPDLSSLWFEGNPCSLAAGPNYRACVLRFLPNLQLLDNKDVTKAELAAALGDHQSTLPDNVATCIATRQLADEHATMASAQAARVRPDVAVEGTDMRRPPMMGNEFHGDHADVSLNLHRRRAANASNTAAAAAAATAVVSQMQLDAMDAITNNSGHSYTSGNSESVSIQTQTPATSPNSCGASMSSRLNASDMVPTTPRQVSGNNLTSSQTSIDISDARIVLRRNANLLSSTLCIIRELDTPALEVLIQAIQDIINSRNQH